MGIKGMNRFIRTFCPEALRIVKFSELRGKRIAVDMSVYMYRFKKEKTLIADMFVLFHYFKDCGIIPIFVFDGQPPKEKQEELNERRRIKMEATEKYERLKRSLMDDSMSLNTAKKEEITKEMIELEKEFITLKNSDLRIMRALIESFGFAYVYSSGEADELCALMEQAGVVDGIMSEDGDMVAYGCSMIYRVPNLVSASCEELDVAKTRKLLGITKSMMCEMCVLAGTDYTKHLKLIHKVSVDPIMSDVSSEKVDEEMDDSFSIEKEDTMDFFKVYSILTEIRGNPTISCLEKGIVSMMNISILDTMLEMKKIENDMYEVHKKTMEMYEISFDELDATRRVWKEAMEDVEPYSKEKIIQCIQENGLLVCP